MQAAQYSDNSSDLSTLRIVEAPKPVPRAGEALVKVKAAAVNPIDSKVMQGHLKGAGWAMPLPFTMGYDFAGTIEAVGEGVEGFASGEDVFAVNWGAHKHDAEGEPVGGAFAEFISIPVKKLSKKPAGLSFELAAAVALVGTTAHQILFDCARVESGSKVLILGGSSAVGSIAIQLAKARGAWVATTCSSRTLDYTSQFGADKVINYREHKWEEDESLRDLDAVIDTVGEEGGFGKAQSNGVMKSTGSFVSIASFDAGFDPSAHAPLKFAAFYCLANSPSVQDELAKMLISGSLKLNIDKEFDFTEEGVRESIKYQNSGASCGKNVLRFH